MRVKLSPILRDEDEKMKMKMKSSSREPDSATRVMYQYMGAFWLFFSVESVIIRVERDSHAVSFQMKRITPSRGAH
jgi:hypothetical protein